VAEAVVAEQAAALPTDFVAAHAAVKADQAIQFQLLAVEDFKPPEWLRWLEPIGDVLRVFAPFAKYIFWGFLAIVVGTIIYMILREFTDIRWPWRKSAIAEDELEWVPDAAPARALLAEADALAARGHYAEAAHLLLLRSVEDIEKRKPDILKPSSTSREISVAPGLPEKAQTTFAFIARQVEASLFGGRAIDSAGWDQCREAYGRFALAGEWR
jgi:hypothetical protein